MRHYHIAILVLSIACSSCITYAPEEYTCLMEVTDGGLYPNIKLLPLDSIKNIQYASYFKRPGRLTDDEFNDIKLLIRRLPIYGDNHEIKQMILFDKPCIAVAVVVEYDAYFITLVRVDNHIWKIAEVFVLIP
jgi:hypothetical protein